MITFIEHEQTGYAMRTWDNARLSDLTIAFAIDFTTPGEILTRKAAYGKYRSVDLNVSDVHKEIEFLHLEIKNKGIKKLNIAGNGLYTFSQLWHEQNFVDAIMLQYLDHLVQGDKTISIRSGGQTGVDEAALKAADELGLETICLAPKHWMFRDINGRDIIGREDLFLKRFGEKYDITDIL
jgi:hypothetical protein